MNVHVEVFVTSSMILRRGQAVLLLRKKGGSWPGHWTLPSGKVEIGETFPQAAIRETLEETGVLIAASEIVVVGTNGIMIKNRWYLGVMFEARAWSGEPKICEPDKFEIIEWGRPRDYLMIPPLKGL